VHFPQVTSVLRRIKSALSWTQELPWAVAESQIAPPKKKKKRKKKVEALGVD
jgi:hypothetical protein